MLLTGTMLAGLTVPAEAQRAPRGGGGRQPAGGSGPAGPAQAIPAATPQGPGVTVTDPNALTIKTLRVEGSQRIEPETVLSYTRLRVGIKYTAETLDQALKDLQASDLFADYSI